MWRDYSSGYLKNNRSSSLSVMTAALISSLLLSLLCGLFYNAWKYEVERIKLEEGGWHGRLTGDFTEEDIDVIKNFANVQDVVVSDRGTADICFRNVKAVFSDMPRIAEQMGVSPEKADYNYELLAMYLVRDSGDAAPRLLFPMFVLITLMASLSLIMIIHNSFAVSMNARIHQFGIFASVGATPRQIRMCLLQETAALCAVPVIAGNLLGIAASRGVLHLANVLLGSSIAGRHEAVFGYHPSVCVLTLLVTVITIWISAWLPARKLSRMTPLDAIRNTGELQLKRRTKSCLPALLFGVEGELACNALAAQRRALRTASLSFLSAFMAFAVMQCFFALSGISTRETYFERYQRVWDVMVTVRDAQVDAFGETAAIREIAGVESAIVYQRAAAKRVITVEEMSEEMKSFGGFSHASGSDVTPVGGGWLVNAPILILDDNSFLAYCAQTGAPQRLDGAVILNQIRDVTDPDFRHPRLMPYVKAHGAGESAVSVLLQPGSGEMTAAVPVLAYTEIAPALREEYATRDYYELVHFVPASLWKEIKGQTGKAPGDCRICVKGRENVTLEELDLLQRQINQLISSKYTTESENRIREYETNSRQIQGMMAVFGGFCVLLAIIGTGSVFSNTLGFVRQRKREFARYLSIGMTPKQLRKMFSTEALVIAVRPVLISLPPVVIAVGYMLRASYLEMGVFMAEAPYLPILLFLSAIVSSVALAYCLAWRNVRKISLAEVLRDDTMM